MSLVRSMWALFIFLVFMGFHGTAWAQTGCVPNPNMTGPPFIDGCPLPAAALNFAIKNTTNFWGLTRATLSALPVAGFVSGQTVVYRAGYNHQGDGGDAIYTYISDHCNLNSGVGDGGSQQQASDGGCYLAHILASGPDVRLWGVTADGTTNDHDALQNAINWATQPGAQFVSFPPGILNFPPGIIYLASPITATITPATSTAFTLQGAGPDISMIRSAPAVDIFDITVDIPSYARFLSFHIDGLTFLASGNTSTAATAVNLQATSAFAYAAQSSITNTTFRGSDGYNQSHCWLVGFDTNWISNINFINDNFLGCATPAGVGIALGNGANIGVVYNISLSNFSNLADGIIYGSNIEGVSISQTNFTPDLVGIEVPPGAVGTDELIVADGTQFGFNTYGIYAYGFLANLIVNSVLTGGPMTTAILAHNVYLCSITGNIFQGDLSNIPPYVAGSGIKIDATSGQPCVISGNSISGWTTGIELAAPAYNVAVANNAYLSNITNIVTNGPDNDITGFGIHYAIVSGFADNGGGLVRLTVNTTAGLVSGEVVLVTPIIGGIQTTLSSKINVIDGTHLDLPTVFYNGAINFQTGSYVTIAVP